MASAKDRSIRGHRNARTLPPCARAALERALRAQDPRYVWSVSVVAPDDRDAVRDLRSLAAR